MTRIFRILASVLMLTGLSGCSSLSSVPEIASLDAPDAQLLIGPTEVMVLYRDGRTKRIPDSRVHTNDANVVIGIEDRIGNHHFSRRQVCLPRTLSFDEYFGSQVPIPTRRFAEEDMPPAAAKPKYVCGSGVKRVDYASLRRLVAQPVKWEP